MANLNLMTQNPNSGENEKLPKSNKNKNNQKPEAKYDSDQELLDNQPGMVKDYELKDKIRGTYQNTIRNVLNICDQLVSGGEVVKLVARSKKQLDQLNHAVKLGILKKVS